MECSRALRPAPDSSREDAAIHCFLRLGIGHMALMTVSIGPDLILEGGPTLLRGYRIGQVPTNKRD